MPDQTAAVTQTAKETLDFAPNYCHIIEIDVTPKADKPTWASALEGITNVKSSSEETKDEDEFYDMLDFTDNNITKVKHSLAFTGFRKYGSKAQDFIQSKALGILNERKTSYRWIMPDGTKLQGNCTLCDLIAGSGMGDSKNKGDFSFTLAINTIDTKIIGDAIYAPESISATDVTTTVGATTPIGETIAPTDANQAAHFVIEDESIATVDSDGNVTGVAAGSTIVTIKAASKPSVTKQVKVTVSAS